MFTNRLVRCPRVAVAALALVAVTLGASPPAAPAVAAASKPAVTAAKKAPVKSAARTSATAKQAAKPAAYRPHRGPAPADEYFGRLQMSILGVRNKVKDLGADADTHPAHYAAVLGNALWVEDAMRDWAKKYPFDRWLPRYAYALEQMYERIPGTDAHRRAIKQVSYLTAYFPQTVYGKVGRAKLVAGIPVPDPSETPIVLTELQRLALLDGKVVPTVPPAATPVPSPSPAALPPSHGSGGPPAAQSSPLPAPTPLATTTPTASVRP